MESVRGGGAGERAGGPPMPRCRAVCHGRRPGRPPAACVDRVDEQGMEHLVGLRDARQRDPLHRGADGGGRGCRRKAFGEIGRSRVNLRAQCAASGACASACRLCSSSQPAGWPSRPASTRSHASTDTAIVCCRPAAATGSARRAHTSAIRASICRSSPVSPITDGISPASRARPASEM
jgi:hypothetical protein